MVWLATNRRLAPSIQVTELIPVYLAARRGIACSQLSERKGKTTSLDQKGFNRNANRIILYTRNPCASNARFHYRFTWITIHIWFLSPWNFIGKHADAKLIKHLNRRRSYGWRGGVEKAIEASRLPFCFLNSIGRERCPISKIASPIMQYFKQSWNVSVIPAVGEKVAAVRTDDQVDYCRRIICSEFARNAL